MLEGKPERLSEGVVKRLRGGRRWFDPQTEQPSCRDRRTDSATRRWNAGDVRLDVRPRGPEAMFPI
jgi:hypothetical protein